MSEEYSTGKNLLRAKPIPAILHSELTGQPFEQCVMCGKQLLNSSEPYFVEKAFQEHRDFNLRSAVFEYAICLPCAGKMRQSMSRESLARMKVHLESLDIRTRSIELFDKFGYDFEAWISHCLVDGTPRTELLEYQVCALCIGPNLVFDNLPYLLSSTAAEKMTELLSAATLGEFRRFTDEFFGLPPEFRNAIKDRPVLMH